MTQFLREKDIYDRIFAVSHVPNGLVLVRLALVLTVVKSQAKNPIYTIYTTGNLPSMVDEISLSLRAVKLNVKLNAGKGGEGGS